MLSSRVLSGGWLFVPAACLIGMLIGSWRPRATVRELTRQLEESRSAASARPARETADGFGTFARMVRIPDEAAPKARFAPEKPLFSGAATNPPPQSAKDGQDAQPAETGDKPREDRRHARLERLAPEDLRARIAEAQELWSARVDIARAQWLDRLGMDDDESARLFDDAVNGMNDRLHAFFEEVADDVAAGRSRFDHASGARFIHDLSGIVSATYETLAANAPEDKAREVGKMELTDFIDPAVAEPFVRIQDVIAAGFEAEGGL